MVENILNNINNVLEYISSFDKVFLFSDFDGTLVRIRKNPRDVRLSKKAAYILNKIIRKEKIITGIVSGRKVSELELFLGGKIAGNVNLFGCHGAEIKFKDSDILIAQEALKAREGLKLIHDFMVKKYGDLKGIIFEEKENSFALNYRNISRMDRNVLNNIKKDMISFENKYPVRLLNLKKVFEIVPLDVDKSIAIKATMQKYKKLLEKNTHIKLCIGDDVTDEYLFKENKDGINIKIDPLHNKDTNAQFFLSNMKETFIFLNRISSIK